MLQIVEKINAQYEAELARKVQAASEIQPVEETDNVPVSDAMPSQESDASNAVENLQQNFGIVVNQETGVTLINESGALSESEPKLEEAAKDVTCKRGTLKLVIGLSI